MRSTAVLVQHAEKVAEPGDPGLTDLGRVQAERVAERLVRFAPVALLTSPLRRARETAQPAAALLGLTPVVDARLRERVNLEPGQEWSAFLREWRRGTEDRDRRAPGGRTSRETGEDVLAVLEEHARSGRVVAVVTHGGATTDVLRTVLGDAALRRRSPRLLEDGVQPAALTVLSRPPGGPWEVDGIALVDDG